MAGNQEDDGLNDYAVWVEHIFDTPSTIIHKVEKFDPMNVLQRKCAGIIRAKDELDVYLILKNGR